MYKLKPLPKESIPAALQKAERYRLLNEPYEAESICLDILQSDPDNQDALISLILAHTDKFKESLVPAFKKALELLERLSDAHCRIYYRGVIKERRAKTHLARGGPSAGEIAHDWYTKAMDDYEQLLETSSPGKENAALRWNTCARILNENPHIKPAEQRDVVELIDGYE